MARGLSSAIKTQFASGSFVMAHLVKLELDTSYYYTDFSSDIIDGSDTYTANGFLTSIGAVTESSRMNIGSTSLAFSAVDQTIVSDVLSNGHLNRAVTIKRVILDTSNVVIGSFSIYSGFIEGMSIRDSGGTSSIAFSVANHWADFARREGRRTNNSSQQHYFIEDKCFEFADQAGKKLYWGNMSIDLNYQLIDYGNGEFGEIWSFDTEDTTDTGDVTHPHFDPFTNTIITYDPGGTGGIVTHDFGSMT